MKRHFIHLLSEATAHYRHGISLWVVFIGASDVVGFGIAQDFGFSRSSHRIARLYFFKAVCRTYRNFTVDVTQVVNAAITKVAESSRNIPVAVLVDKVGGI